MRCVSMFSGGAGSWAATKRAVAKYGAENVTLLFADTLKEDADLYRFLPESAAEMGVELVTVADGRTPFQLFRDRRFLGNNRVPTCSKWLKIVPCEKWMKENRDSGDTTIVVGIDWSEIHRLSAIETNWSPFQVWAPMTEKPYMSKTEVVSWMRECGVTPPRGYSEGFPHNNCLAQGCVRGGKRTGGKCCLRDRTCTARRSVKNRSSRRGLAKTFPS